MRVPKVISESEVEPISMELARLHLRLDTYGSPAEHPDDPLVSALITVARESAEKFTGLSLIQKTLEIALDSFPCSFFSWGTPRYIELPGGPVQEIVTVLYQNGSVEESFDTYQFDNYIDPPRLTPDVTGQWPVSDRGVNSIRIRYLAGYSSDGDSPFYEALPKSIKQAMLLTIGHLYENREASSIVQVYELPMGAQALLRNYRIEKAMA